MVPVRPGDTAHLPLHGAREARPRVAAGRGHLQGAGRASQSEGRGGRPTGAPTSWSAGAIRAPRRTAAAPKKPREPIASLWDAPGTVSPTRADLFFEDRQIGELTDLDSHTFGRDEIIAFAREFDPQPFHLDEAAAKASLFGGLCASGWHTAAYAVRGNIRSRLAGNEAARAKGIRLAAYGPSPGFRNLTWMKPAYVGDTLEYRGRLAQKIDLKSRPDRGIVATDHPGPQPEGRDRVLRHLADPGRAPRALPTGVTPMRRSDCGRLR